MSVPFSLLFEQGRMLRTLGRITAKSLLPIARPAHNPGTIADVEQTVAPPSERLLQHYLAWSGADPKTYQDHLPPHLFTQFALPVCAPQLEQLRYKLSGIINQGCAVKINAPLEKGQSLLIKCALVSVTESNGRARVLQKLEIATPNRPVALEVDIHTTFIIGRREKRAEQNRSQPEWLPIDTWQARADDGWQFALLTGDLNPIHWFEPIAKLSPFQGKVLHGFGSFVRSFEILQRDLRQRDQPAISFAEVRFIRPVPLPSRPLSVVRSQSTGEGGHFHWQLQDEDGNPLMVGLFS